jgi:hypothetical protein
MSAPVTSRRVLAGVLALLASLPNVPIIGRPRKTPEVRARPLTSPIPCFCDGTVQVFESERNGDFVKHSEPECLRFKGAEPWKFMQDLHEHLTKGPG